jgi:hypothetical protein
MRVNRIMAQSSGCQGLTGAPAICSAKLRHAKSVQRLPESILPGRNGTVEWVPRYDEHRQFVMQNHVTQSLSNGSRELFHREGMAHFGGTRFKIQSGNRLF